MSQPKGPKVDLPDELVAELHKDMTGSEGDTRASSDEHAPAPAAPEEGATAAASAEERSPEEQLAEAQDRHLRLAAEFENFKRRALKERQDLFNYANENLVKELLSTVDNLERALEHARQTEEGDDIEKFLEGVELTYRSLMQVLEKAGVQKVEGRDKPFDPKVQEAIRRVPNKECEPGTVVEIYQPGYTLKDRLLRPALVAVSSGPGEESE